MADNKRIKTAWTITALLVLIAIAILWIGRQIAAPRETINDFSKIPPKGAGRFERISWDDALDLTAEAMLAAERRYGPEAVWPYYYAGTMGLVMRDGINRLRHAKRYSQMYQSICTTLAWTGYIAGTGTAPDSDAPSAAPYRAGASPRDAASAQQAASRPISA